MSCKHECRTRTIDGLECWNCDLFGTEESWFDESGELVRYVVTWNTKTYGHASA